MHIIKRNLAGKENLRKLLERVIAHMLNMTIQDVYEIVREHGVSGLIERYADAVQEWQSSFMDAESSERMMESITLMQQQITDKLKHSGDLYVLKSVATNSIFIDCYDLKNNFRAYFFTSKEKAEEYRKKLRQEHYAVEIDQVISGRRRAVFWAEMLRSGCGTVVLNAGNKQYVEHIGSLTEIPEYDGFAGIDHPLLNCRMNALFSTYCQDLAAGKMMKGIEEEIKKYFKTGHFITPVIYEGEIDKIDHSEISFRYMFRQHTNEDGILITSLPIFTDQELMNKWCEVERMENYTGCILDIESLFSIFESFKIRDARLNWATHCIVIDRADILEITQQE